MDQFFFFAKIYKIKFQTYSHHHSISCSVLDVFANVKINKKI